MWELYLCLCSTLNYHIIVMLDKIYYIYIHQSIHDNASSFYIQFYMIDSINTNQDKITKLPLSLDLLQCLLGRKLEHFED